MCQIFFPSKGSPCIISSNSHDNLGSRLCYFPHCGTDKETETQPLYNSLKVTVTPCQSWDLSPGSLTRGTAHYPLGDIVRGKVFSFCICGQSQPSSSHCGTRPASLHGARQQGGHAVSLTELSPTYTPSSGTGECQLLLEC